MNCLGTNDLGRCIGITKAEVSAIKKEDNMNTTTTTQYSKSIAEAKSLMIDELTMHILEPLWGCYSSGSEHLYVLYRLKQVKKNLGTKTMRNLWSEAEALFRKTCRFSDEDWRIITKGTDQEQEVWFEKAFRKCHPEMTDKQWRGYSEAERKVKELAQGRQRRSVA